MRRKTNLKLKQWLLDNGNNRTIKEMLPEINIIFNENYKENELRKYLIRNRIPYKYECEWKSHNKAGSSCKIGTEYTKKDGMVIVKVSRNEWKDKQRLIYEQYHNVKLSPNEYVIFLDNNRKNFNIDNLKVVSKLEASYLANYDLKSSKKEVTKLGINVADLIIKTKEVSKKYE